MLSLGRNPGEYIVIDENIVIQVVSVNGMLRLAIDAPRSVTIERGEVYEQTHPTPDCIKRSQKMDAGKPKKAKKVIS